MSNFFSDRCSEMAAGRAAGVGTLVLVEGVEIGPCAQPEDFLRVHDLQAVRGLLR
ncbi:MAG: hypothetical protein ACP5EP_06815 [Acidobacteriaceae bacterium]